MPESFGARLRQHREKQQIDLRAIAEHTKIKFSMLESLERDDVSQWPAGIFRRGYVRTYAKFIGLDPDSTVREFLQVHPDAGEVTAASISAVRESYGGGHQSTFKTIMGSALGSLSRLRRGPAVDAGPAPDPSYGISRAAVGTASAAMSAAVVGTTAAIESTSMPPELALAWEATASHEPHASLEIELAGIELPEVELADAELSLPDLDEPEPVVAAQPVQQSEPPMVAPPAVSATDRESAADFAAVAQVCTEFGRVKNADDAQALLQDVARVLHAVGLIVWVWDSGADALQPVLAHGYPDKLVQQLPPVPADADNATAAAFRSEQTCAIAGSEQRSGALVVPLLAADSCAGVLAIELQKDSGQKQSVRAAATIFAAVLGQLVGHGTRSEPRPQPQMRPAVAMTGS